MAKKGRIGLSGLLLGLLVVLLFALPQKRSEAIVIEACSENCEDACMACRGWIFKYCSPVDGQNGACTCCILTDPNNTFISCSLDGWACYGIIVQAP